MIRQEQTLRRSVNPVARAVMVTLAETAVAHAPDQAQHQPQDPALEVRVRGIYLGMQKHSDAYEPLGIPADAIRVSSKWIPEVDLEYRFTPHWLSELVLTDAQSQTATVQRSVLGGPTVLGTLKHLPPTLMLKYDFQPEDRFQP